MTIWLLILYIIDHNILKYRYSSFIILFLNKAYFWLVFVSYCNGFVFKTLNNNLFEQIAV